MPIALESNQIDSPGLRRGMFCGSAYNSQETARSVAVDLRLTAFNSTSAAKNLADESEDQVDTSSSSSIGRNSDSSDGDGDSGEVEVQSPCKGPLDCLDALEEVLPVKRGMSKFYCGKSKSFTSLGDATSCSTIKEIVKPENAYTRKRKNLLAHRTFWDKNCNFPPRSNSGGISKRPFNSIRSTLALGMNMSSSYENINNISNNNSDSSSSNSNSNSSSPKRCRPPLYPDSKRPPVNESSSPAPSPPGQNLPSWRSFSLSDLQCAAAATPGITGLVINDDRNNKDKLQ
ncbi:protein OXIDATIVE STRESS 3 LIKE 1-like [Rhododendron vialii]|uniref:protein OXIDATIVE STRESS 3 LIKE 1-like n=1 Tax=Rhododendron vialii TaxID=182163 RepID=UPI00265E1ED9|nr:protein OXIDATIVE STRESS 3 LIKE 1-like [Rhododendron vialii]